MRYTPGPYGRLARFVMQHRLPVSLAMAALVAISLVLGLPPKVDPNLLGLLPGDEPSVTALRALNEKEGGVSLVTLAFEADDPALLPPFLKAVTGELSANPRIEWAIHEIEPELAQQLALLQLEASDVQELNLRLRGALSLGRALNPIVTQRLMAMGPITDRIAKLSETPSLLGGTEGTARIVARPTDSSHNRPFAVALMEDLDAILASHATPGIRTTWIGGAYRHTVEDFKGIQSDLIWTTGLSLFLVLCVIMLAFRSWRGMVLVFVPLISANAIVLAFVWLALDSLNTYTSFGTAILIGLGIDFAVHLVGRYREYRASGLEVEIAVQRAWDRTGPPCVTAALTSAAGFLALAAADFQGFAQLGLLLAVGLIICLLVMLILLPVLIPLVDRDGAPLLGTVPGRVSASKSDYRLAPAGLSIAVLVTGFVALRTLPHLEWEFDISELRRDGLSYAELTETERALARDSYSPMVLDIADADGLESLHHEAELAMGDGRLPHVGRIVSVLSVLPKDQDERLVQLEQLVSLLEHENFRYLPPPLTAKLLPLKGVVITPHSAADLPLAMQDLLGARDADRGRLLVFPKGNMWDLRETAALESELNDVFGEGRVAGDYPTLGALYRVILRDMPLVGGLSVLMVILLTAIDLRRVHWVAAAMGTLLAGMIWAAFAIRLVGVKLSIMNIVGIPILVGIGVDVVIHLLHRLRDEGPGGVRRALRTTGVAASISTMTTIASFASLTIAGNRGVRSMGLLVVFGLMAVFFATCILLPLAWAAGFRVMGRVPNVDRSTETPAPAPDREV